MNNTKALTSSFTALTANTNKAKKRLDVAKASEKIVD